MSKLVSFRPLCDGCGVAEAKLWCKDDSRALCGQCDSEEHTRGYFLLKHKTFPIGCAISPTCSRCAQAPAAVFCPLHRACFCDPCMEETQAVEVSPQRSVGEVSPRRNDTRSPHVFLEMPHALPAISLVFQKMDFSTTSPSSASAPVARLCRERPLLRRRRGDLEANDPSGRPMAPPNSGFPRCCPHGGPHVDLSEFKTPVPVPAPSSPSPPGAARLPSSFFSNHEIPN